MNQRRHAWMYLAQPDLGGAQLSTLGLADGARARGWKISFTVSFPGPFIEEGLRRGHQVSLIPMPEGYRYLVGRSLAGKVMWMIFTVYLAVRVIFRLRAERPDLIYVFGRRDLLVCAPAAFLLSLPVVYHLRGLNPNLNDLADRLVMWLARLINVSLVCNSEYTLDQARRKGWKAKAEMVYNGIDFDSGYDLTREEARARFDVPTDALVIGCASRISPGKNFEGLLRLTALLKPMLDRPLLLLIAGAEDVFQAGKLIGELKSLAAELGLEDNVRWLGHIREVGPFYRALDLFVSLTRTESFGRMFVESMAAGVPTLATRVGGVPEIITDGVDGIFIPVDDPAEAARRAFEVLSDPGRARALGLAGRESARGRFSLEHHVDGMVACFEKAIARVRGRAYKLAWCYISQPNRGGAQIATLSLAGGLGACDWRMEFCFSNPGPLIDECRAAGLTTGSVPMPEWYRFMPVPRASLAMVRWLWSSFFLALRLGREIRRQRPDLIYLIDKRAVLLCFPSSFLLRIPMIYHLHGVFHGEMDPFTQAPLRLARRLHSGVICNSLATKRIINHHGFAPDADIVYNGIRFDESFEMDRAAAREKFGVEPGTAAIGCMARLSPDKNIETLLHMAAEMKRSSPRPFALLIAGEEDPKIEGQFLPTLKAMAAELDVADHVRWLGYVREIGAFYRALDVFILLSREESFGRVYAEAMAAEVPAIGTRVGGIPEVIEDGKTGLMVEIEDAVGAARVVSGLLDDPARAAALARAGREAVRGRFSIEAHVGEMCKVFDRTVTRRKG